MHLRDLFSNKLFWTSTSGVVLALGGVVTTAMALNAADNPKQVALTAAVGGLFASVAAFVANVGSVMADRNAIRAARKMDVAAGPDAGEADQGP